MDRLKDKIVIVTGASSGIGEAIARHLASRGAVVILAARRMDRLLTIQQSILDQKGKAHVFRADVTNRTEMEELASFCLRECGRIDVMVNNAGIMPLSRLELLRVDEWEKMVDVNIKGVLYGIAAVLPIMQSQKSGQFIHLASLAGHRVPLNSGSAVYSATKFAVRAIAEGLRQEVKPYNIRSTILSPGAIQSELTESVKDPLLQENIQRLSTIAISAESVAKAAAYAIEQEDDCDISEIIIRPTNQVT